MVVRIAAVRPTPSVIREGKREVPLEPRRRMNSEIRNARNVNAQAIVRAIVRTRDAFLREGRQTDRM